MNKKENNTLKLIYSVPFKQLSENEMTHILGGTSDQGYEEVGIETTEGEGEEEGCN